MAQQVNKSVADAIEIDYSEEKSKIEEAVQSVAKKATKRSEDALDECYYFLREYPKTGHTKEIQRITNSLQKILKKQSNL